LRKPRLIYRWQADAASRNIMDGIAQIQAISPPGKMTELDHTVLAIVARDGPLSTYAVCKVFEGSLTDTWSASTGSIYPSIRRLVAAGLLEAAPPEGGRGRKELTITAAGTAALSEWLTGGTSAIASATPDPIRTRTYFLSLITPAQRRQFLEDALGNTEAALSVAKSEREARIASGVDNLQYLASAGVIYELTARRGWLRMMVHETA
jgi:DNA-binding PadR family transcriptional regulator